LTWRLVEVRHMVELAPDVVRRIRQLVRLLSSDKPGEVIAATQAINRTLKNNGCDIHALADSIGDGKLSEADMRKLYDAGFAAGAKSAKGASFHNVEPTWHEIATECAGNPRYLRGDREVQFIKDMCRRLVHGDEPTQRQAQWLRDIYARIRQ